MAKKQKKGKDLTQRDYILLDRTGSMDVLWNEAVSSVNSYVEKLSKDKVDTKVTLVVFDKDVVPTFDVVRDNMKPSGWKHLSNKEVTPRGMTPLNDSVAKLVRRVKDENPDRAAIIIMTDGYENSSVEFPGEQGRLTVKAMLDECRAKNWQVIFLGANFDNAQQAMSYGNMRGQTVNSSARNLRATMEATASYRGLYGATGQSMSFTEDEKKKLAEE